MPALGCISAQVGWFGTQHHLQLHMHRIVCHRRLREATTFPTHSVRVLGLPGETSDAARADRSRWLPQAAVARQNDARVPAGFTGRTSADGGGPGFRLPAVAEGGSDGRSTPTLQPLSTASAAALSLKQQQRQRRGWLLQPPVLLLALGACIAVLQVRQNQGLPHFTEAVLVDAASGAAAVLALAEVLTSVRRLCSVACPCALASAASLARFSPVTGTVVCGRFYIGSQSRGCMRFTRRR